MYSQRRILAFQRVALSRELQSRRIEILVGKKVRDGDPVPTHATSVFAVDGSGESGGGESRNTAPTHI